MIIPTDSELNKMSKEEYEELLEKVNNTGKEKGDNENTKQEKLNK